MLKAINVWSMPDGLSPLKQMELAAQAGFEGVEFALNLKGPLSLESDAAEFAALKRASDERGVALTSLACGLYWDFSFTSPDAQEREQAMKIARFQLRMAREMGVDAILLVPGAVGVDFKPEAPVVRYDIAYERAFDALCALAPVAETEGVTIGVENVWNKMLNSPLEMLKLIDQVASPRVKVYLDVGNVLLTGYPEHWIDILGERIVRVHVKDFKRAIGNLDGFCDLLAGDVDFPLVIDALKRVGYDGWLTAEMNAYAKYPDQIVYNTSAAMDRILRRV